MVNGESNKAFRIITVGEITTEFGNNSGFVKSIRPAEHKNVLQLSSLVRILETGHATFDLIVVYQNRPDEFLRSEVDRLFSAAVLTRIVCVYSSWCESDGRTRDVWPFAVRVPIDRAEKRLQQEVSVLLGEREPLPATASRDESFQFDFGINSQTSYANDDRHVFVITPDRRYGETLTALLHRNFPRVTWFAELDELRKSSSWYDSPSLVLFDIDPWSETHHKHLTALKESVTDCVLFAIANYPRNQDRKSLAEFGFSGVLPKLASVDQLAKSLRVA